MDAVELGLFAGRIGAVCDEMGAVLRRAAFSPNIRDRLDFSCAVFDAEGELAAQAAHIPVHLGSMAYAMRDLVGRMGWAPGDQVVVNDPFLGGTHLPDVTLIAPVFAEGRLVAFVASRAHHANIGADAPGSMPLSRTLEEEGVILPPAHLWRGREREAAPWGAIVAATGGGPEVEGDFAAQASANRAGVARLEALVAELGAEGLARSLAALQDYGERMSRAALAELPAGAYTFTDYLDDDGAGQVDLPIRVALEVTDEGVAVDFAGTAGQTAGNVNCPLAVAAAAVFYAFRCLMPTGTPACAGAFRPIALHAPEGCLVNARRPAAVAAGNVETSSRLVDAVLGALAGAIPERIPAASQGTMNNVAMGGVGKEAGSGWHYYETVGGGMGAGRDGGGLSGVHSHMTNTLNTPVEALEMAYPLRVAAYRLRRGSGGAGMRRGGDGLERTYELLAPARITLLTERRRHAPWGLAGGADGAPGENRLNDTPLPGKTTFTAEAGDRLTIATPGGGGWGRPASINEEP